MKNFLKLTLIIAVALSTTGCASLNKKLKALFGKSQKSEAVASAIKPTTPRFSEEDNYKIGAERQYKRMNREQFESDAQVGDQAGSLWVMEGQGAYLFAQNTKRLAGDFVNINIEGTPQQQLQTKSNVIAKLLKKLERGSDPAPSVRNPASKSAPAAGSQQPNQQAVNVDQNGASPNPAAPADGTAAAGDQAKNPNNSNFDVTQVPARIVETLKDGSYRVKGAQQFMIGKREYKVIVTGIIRPEDFNEDGTSATKILDGQFDIVSNKKGVTTL